MRSKPDSNLSAASILPLAATMGLHVLYPTNIAEKTATIILTFIKAFQYKLEQLASTKGIRQHSTQKTFIPDALNNCTFACLRVDRVKQPLEAPYTGPHELNKINGKSSLTAITRNNDNIIFSLQRLKT